MRRQSRTAGIGVAVASGLALTVWAGGALADDVTPPSDMTLPITASPGPVPGDSDIKARLDAAGALTIGGEPVHAALLRKFYAAHDYQPVWGSRQAQATALWHAVLNAGDQGLDPDLFHVADFAKTALSPIERDVLLSDAFLGYADALARGAYPSEARPDDQDLSPGSVDVVATLNTAIASLNPETTINALAPNTPAYDGLRRAYQSYLALVKAGGWPHVPENQTTDRFRLL
ncbi:MAG: hypothetical protein ACHQC9_10860, partial [Alphaproteobacteria bacterium]